MQNPLEVLRSTNLNYALTTYYAALYEIYALSWHSGKKFDQIKKVTHSIFDFTDQKLHTFHSDEVFEKAGNAMGIDADVVKTVIEGLYK